MEKPTKELSVAFLKNTPRETRSDSHKMIYANGVKMGISPWDVRIIFSCTGASLEDQTNEEQVTIIMSPQHARATLRSLNSTLKSYEDIFGEIPDVDSMLRAKREEVSSQNGAESQSGAASSKRAKRVSKTKA